MIFASRPDVYVSVGLQLIVARQRGMVDVLWKVSLTVLNKGTVDPAILVLEILDAVLNFLSPKAAKRIDSPCCS